MWRKRRWENPRRIFQPRRSATLAIRDSRLGPQSSIMRQRRLLSPVDAIPAIERAERELLSRRHRHMWLLQHSVTVVIGVRHRGLLRPLTMRLSPPQTCAQPATSLGARACQSRHPIFRRQCNATLAIETSWRSSRRVWTTRALPVCASIATMARTLPLTRGASPLHTFLPVPQPKRAMHAIKALSHSRRHE